MTDCRIIPVPPASSDGEVVVVEVRQHGSRPLDVRLVGCEGQTPYVATIEHRNVGLLKRSFKGTDEDWDTILSYFLLQQQPEDRSIHVLADVHMVHTIKANRLDVLIRKDAQGTKVTLGEIVLPQDEEFELFPFEWAQASALAHSRTLQEVTRLNAQLKDFIKTKNETETAMLQQFMALLNEKKRKMRDQSRLLAGAKVDDSTGEAMTRKAAASRTFTKASATPSEPDAEEMEIEDDSGRGQGAATPDRVSEDETEDEEL